MLTHPLLRIYDTAVNGCRRSWFFQLTIMDIRAGDIRISTIRSFGSFKHSVAGNHFSRILTMLIRKTKEAIS
jgi:hypothetical protein